MTCNTHYTHQVFMWHSHSVRRRSLMSVTNLLLLLIILSIFSTSSSLSTTLGSRKPSSSTKSSNNEVRGCEITFDPICKTQACFIFLDEDPFVILPPRHRRDKSIFEEKNPFPCKDFRKRDIDGVAFQLLELFFRNTTNTQNDYLCYFGGEKCEWNNLVNYVTFSGRTHNQFIEQTEEPNQLVLLGSLLETPSRLRKESIASVSYADDFLVIVGRTDDITESLVAALVGPLDGLVWLMVSCTIFVAFLTGLLLKYSDPTRDHAMLIESRSRRAWCMHHCFDSVIRALAHLFHNEEIVGASDSKDDIETLRHFVTRESSRLRFRGQYAFPAQDDLHQHPDSNENTPSDSHHGYDEGHEPELELEPATWTNSMHQRRKSLSFRQGCHVFIKVAFSITVTFFVGIFLLFYEAALTNFLFEQNTPELKQQVTSLTATELQKYAVLHNSAVNDVWVNLQGRNKNLKGQEKPWKDCKDIDTCFEEIKNGVHSFLVIQDKVARFKIKNDASCSELSIFKTKETLFDFNAGLIYGPNTTARLRETIDLEFLNSRVSGDSKRIYDKFLENSECQLEVNSITWRVYIVPTVIVGCGVGALILVQLGLIYCNHLERKRHENAAARYRLGFHQQSLPRSPPSTSRSPSFTSSTNLTSSTPVNPMNWASLDTLPV